MTYGGLELTKGCLESLSRETWPRLEVIVVDNASSDGTPGYLMEAAKDPRVRTILNAENRGFAAANNQGIAAARGEIVVLLNNDTVVPPGLIGRLARHLERDPSIGLLCPTTNFCGNEARVEPDYTEISGLPAYRRPPRRRVPRARLRYLRRRHVLRRCSPSRPRDGRSARRGLWHRHVRGRRLRGAHAGRRLPCLLRRGCLRSSCRPGCLSPALARGVRSALEEEPGLLREEVRSRLEEAHAARGCHGREVERGGER